jgi:hypothetical protein
MPEDRIRLRSVVAVFGFAALSGVQANAQVNVTQKHNNPSRDACTDSTGGHGHATYTYKVCDADTQTCSNQVTVRF